MPELVVSWDAKTLEQLRAKTVDRAVFRALKKAGGDALRALRAEAKRRTRDRIRIRAGYLAGSAFPLRYARGSSVGELAWTMKVSGRAVPLGEYPRRQTKKGVSVEVQRGKRSLIRGAFLARAKSGRQSVFLRPSKLRYPMGHRLGLSVADAMADGMIPQWSFTHAERTFTSAFHRLLPLELGKR
jgi:hypothetical protein